jgi:hypothetical protein
MKSLRRSSEPVKAMTEPKGGSRDLTKTTAELQEGLAA